ncbi:MAG: hypothetical protein ACMG6E_03755 [Candidatus Roizmanbacteria bacterium]
MSKNVLFVVLTYLKCDELFSFILTCGKIYNKIVVDPYFKQVAVQAYSGFFFQQFIPPTQDFVERVHSIGSQTTATTSKSSMNSIFFGKQPSSMGNIFGAFL